MEEEPYLAKAIYSFDAKLEGEVHLAVGDLVLVTKTEDRYWLYGQIADICGRFPRSSVTRIEAPRLTQGQVHYAAIADFAGEQLGDLTFKRGDVVIGLYAIDANWWYGRNPHGKEGVFPLSFTWSFNLGPSKSQSRSTVFVRKTARVIQDLVAQLSEELDLRKGDVVTVTGETADGWYEGEYRGKSGIFPKGFVSILSDSEAQAAYSTTVVATTAPAQGTNGYTSAKTDIRPYAIVKFDYDAQYLDELTLRTGQIVYLVRHVNADWLEGEAESQTGIFPSAFVDVVVDCDSGSSQIIDQIIERNLMELSSTVPLIPSNLNFQTVTLPPVPPRKYSESLKSSVPETKTQHNVSEEKMNILATSLSTKIESHQTSISPVGFPVSSNEKLNEESTAEVKQRKSYTRPAPAPPDATSKPAPVRAAPPVPVQNGNEDKVEGRRKRAEREQRQKEEEEELRNCEMRSKRKEQRDNVVSELVVTEQEFARDLKLTYEVFHLHDPQYLLAKGVDGTALFGNILEVIRLSEDIADKLYRSLKEKQTEEVAVGQCFLQLQSEFQKVYEAYCTNYDDAQTLLEKYESNPETLKFFNEGIEILRQKIACFNMGSILIKPVQRILKYPLILGELMKCTEESSPDKRNLEEALTVMTQVATHINESKRKKEIIQKYLANNNGEGTVGRRVSRISLHSVAKKSSRLGMILKSSLGIAPTTKDSAFDALESRFSELVHGVSAALRDVSALCEQLKSMLQLQLSVSEAFASFYGEKNRDPLVDHFRTTQRNILLQHWSTFDSYILQFVTGPLIALSEAFQGPELLVQKRRDKLLDFDIAVEKLSKNRDPSQQRSLQEEENVAKNTYVALNSQLLEQLPKLIEHGYLIYKRCLSSFVYARKLLVGRATKELLELVDKPQIASLHGEIVDDFSVAHSKAAEKLAAISFFSKSFKSLFVTSNQEPAVSPKTALHKNSGKTPFTEGSMTVQSRETVTLLKSKYKSEDLYMVTGRCDVKEALDLAANPGLVVAVIKREDPMGRTERWLVDAGDVRGFLLAKNLTPLPSSSVRPASGVSLTESVGSSTDFSKDKSSVEDTSEPSSARRFYDDPPTYEEASEMVVLSTMEEYSNEHRYCDIAEQDYEKVEDNTSPIYVDIDEVAATVKEFTVTEVFFAAYSFEARSPLEVDITEGEAVRVFQKCDEGGNSEWWLVETESGKRGYAPAAYLKPL